MNEKQQCKKCLKAVEAELFVGATGERYAWCKYCRRALARTLKVGQLAHRK